MRSIKNAFTDEVVEKLKDADIPYSNVSVDPYGKHPVVEMELINPRNFGSSTLPTDPIDLANYIYEQTEIDLKEIDVWNTNNDLLSFSGEWQNAPDLAYASLKWAEKVGEAIALRKIRGIRRYPNRRFR